jgi:hypothetical protein
MVQMINGESSALIDNFVRGTKKKNFFALNDDVLVKLINAHHIWSIFIA